MASHYLGTNRGKSCFTDLDFSNGNSSTATDQIELRILDGANLTKKDVIFALEGFIRYLENPVWTAAAGIDVKL